MFRSFSGFPVSPALVVFKISAPVVREMLLECHLCMTLEDSYPGYDCLFVAQASPPLASFNGCYLSTSEPGEFVAEASLPSRMHEFTDLDHPPLPANYRVWVTFLCLSTHLLPACEIIEIIGKILRLL